MATLKQIDANRRNSQRSTGPLTPEGKHAASGNALQSGIYAEALISPGERAQDLETLTTEITIASIPPPLRPATSSTPSSATPGSSAVSPSPKPPPSTAIAPAALTTTKISATPPSSAPHQRKLFLLDAIQRRINATERNSKPSKRSNPRPSPRNPKSPKPLREIGFVSKKWLSP